MSRSVIFHATHIHTKDYNRYEAGNIWWVALRKPNIASKYLAATKYYEYYTIPPLQYFIDQQLQLFAISGENEFSVYKYFVRGPLALALFLFLPFFS